LAVLTEPFSVFSLKLLAVLPSPSINSNIISIPSHDIAAKFEELRVLAWNLHRDVAREFLNFTVRYNSSRYFTHFPAVWALLALPIARHPCACYPPSIQKLAIPLSHRRVDERKTSISNEIPGKLKVCPDFIGISGISNDIPVFRTKYPVLSR
jgi:hypothetical protein